MNKRTKALDITPAVKARVWERDGGLCVICGSGMNTAPNSHYIARSQGGLGIEQNVGTMCVRCHQAYDNGNHGERSWMKPLFREYLMGLYPAWDENDLIYKKGV